KNYNIPYVVIEHSPFHIDVYSSFVQDQIKSTLLAANKVAGVSTYQKNRLLEDGIDRDIEVVWNLMDEAKFSSTVHSDDSKFVITTITRPVRVKDVDTFFEAVAEFINNIGKPNNIEVVAVGHNALFDKNANTTYYQQKAESLGILEYCKFHATLSRNEILNLLQRTHVYVSTSLDEPYGVAVREAMLCGKPVISTKSGGPDDTINSQNGILVDLKDHSAIAAFLSEIYHGKRTFDPEYIRNYVISQSGRDAFLKRMKEFYTIIND
ncbi:MAG: glycosyltransferase, partial [Psychroserpens sp.]|nr:glycosyltransferase [Psychroserpens sp.]